MICAMVFIGFGGEISLDFHQLIPSCLRSCACSILEQSWGNVAKNLPFSQNEIFLSKWENMFSPFVK